MKVRPFAGSGHGLQVGVRFRLGGRGGLEPGWLPATLYAYRRRTRYLPRAGPMRWRMAVTSGGGTLDARSLA